jgi:hypothetical protein
MSIKCAGTRISACAAGTGPLQIFEPISMEMDSREVIHTGQTKTAQDNLSIFHEFGIKEAHDFFSNIMADILQP